MNHYNELISSFQKITATLLFLMTSILTISVYIIQRCTTNWESGVLNSSANQATVGPFNYSYLTLSITLPLVLGICCIAFRLLVNHHLKIWTLLTAGDNINKDIILASDPFFAVNIVPYLLEHKFNYFFLWVFISWTPIVALIIQGIVMIFYAWEFSTMKHSDGLPLSAVPCIFSVCLGIIWTFSYPKYVIKAIKQFK